MRSKDRRVKEGSCIVASTRGFGSVGYEDGSDSMRFRVGSRSKDRDNGVVDTHGIGPISSFAHSNACAIETQP